jgi:hypothetical protein
MTNPPSFLPSLLPACRNLKFMLIPVLSSFAAISIQFYVSLAQAQSVDEADFKDGDREAAPNSDSETVPGLGMSLPTYAGTGCPSGTLNAAISPDQKTLSILFDAYIAEAGGNSGNSRSLLSCQINIPFQVPAGYRVQVVKMDYRGFTALPAATRSGFAAGFRYLESDLRETDGHRMLRKKVFVGPLQDNFTLTSVIHHDRWSPCGKPFVLAAESRLTVISNRANERVFSTIDSLDAVQLPVKFSLRWKKCTGGEVGRDPSNGRGGHPPRRPVRMPFPSR